MEASICGNYHVFYFYKGAAQSKEDTQGTAILLVYLPCLIFYVISARFVLSCMQDIARRIGV